MSEVEADCDPEFPLTVTFEDGSTERYTSVRDLECNLEEFNSEKDVLCRAHDARGRPVALVLELLKVRKLQLR